jgi:PST family polysaccharide transporter
LKPVFRFYFVLFVPFVDQLFFVQFNTNRVPMISSIVAIAMAFTGWGYWALVAKPMLTTGLSAVGAWMSCPWLPGRPRLTPELKEMVGFGMGVTGFTMTDYFARSADRIALGYFYGAGPSGFQNAFRLRQPAELFTQLHDVAVSSLSKLRNAADVLTIVARHCHR